MTRPDRPATQLPQVASKTNDLDMPRPRAQAWASAFQSRQFILYLICGVGSSLVHLVSRVGFSQFMPFGPAVIAAYAVGTVAAFALYRSFVFTEASPEVRKQFVRFCLVYVAWFPLTWAMSVSFLLITSLVLPLALAELFAHGLAVVVPVLINFLINKFFVFKAAGGDQ